MKPEITLGLKTLLAALLLTSASAGAAEYLYDLPFKGQDFKDNEKLFTKLHADTTSQKYGFDISGKRYDFSGEKWTSLKGSEDGSVNENRMIHGKPIYAMRSGVVIACWRSAPENPRTKNNSDYVKNSDGEWVSSPDRLWIHERLRDVSNRTIPKAGNHLIVEHADGTHSLYAHMIPGSIPFDLCPRSEANYDEAGINPIPKNDYPAITGISPTRSYPLTVTKGQRIGYVGNSGESTGPHLHVHLADGDPGSSVAKQIHFRRGIASLVNNNNPYGSWQRFAGDVIPVDMPSDPADGILVWPPRTITSQYVRHGFNSDGFGALFDHLVDSGFKLNWFDGFTSGDTTRYNQIWKPANIAWRAYSRKTSAGYQSVFNQAKADGYVPVQVESYNTPYGVRYAAIFEKKSLGYLARHGLTYAQHIDTYNEAKSKGMSPVSISVVSVNGERRYTVLYHQKSIGAWSIRSQMTSSQYNTAFADMAANGKYPIYLNAYMHNGTAYYTAVFASQPVSNAVGAKHGLTASGFQSYFNSYSSLGYATSLIAGLDGYNYTRYAGVWRK